MVDFGDWEIQNDESLTLKAKTKHLFWYIKENSRVILDSLKNLWNSQDLFYQCENYLLEFCDGDSNEHNMDSVPVSCV